jgi:hypothetical protein
MFGYLSDSLLDSAIAAISHVPQLGWLAWVLRGQVPDFPSITPAEKAQVMEKLSAKVDETIPTKPEVKP